MEQPFKSAYDDIGKTTFNGIINNSPEVVSFKGKNALSLEMKQAKIKARIIARAAAKELETLAKNVDSKTLLNIIGNTFETFNAPSAMNTLIFNCLPELQSEYEEGLRAYNTQFIIDNIDRMNLTSLLDSIVMWISMGYFDSNFIDVMKLDINAPTKYRHQEISQKWNDVDGTVETVKEQRWDEITSFNAFSCAVDMLHALMSKKSYRKARDYALIALEKKDLDEISKANLTLKYILSNVMSKCKVYPDKHPGSLKCKIIGFDEAVLKSYAFIRIHSNVPIRYCCIKFIRPNQPIKDFIDKCNDILIKDVMIDLLDHYDKYKLKHK